MTVAILLAALAAGYLINRLLVLAVQRSLANRDEFWRSLIARTRRPVRFIILILAFAFGTAVAPINPWAAGIVRDALMLCVIAAIAWLLYTAMHIWAAIHLRRYHVDQEDNLLARKHITQSGILLRVASILIITIAIAAMLMTFEPVRQYGVSLLASAGAAGLVAGLALQPLLKNIFAGIQLATTQPIRIDDALLIENEWGQVEEITSTYVVVRLWDWRRLIVPLSYFIEKPFQNWTRETSDLIGTVLIYLDYTAPIDVIRNQAQQIARESKLWNGKVFNLAVTDFRPDVMEVRVLVSASSAGHAFDLRCEMREKLMSFIQGEYPGALPQTRAEIKSGTP
ncbi:mechanosensitive ion channel domain-containing protein [Loktanella sp. SALINAS62]|uniref:mechanosensitive ion channel family protein n=1 Tax=Loktanella sp. SALINAS62 TaxID=2706124 RepID=UPI001B8C48B8|nr:mechanosensitive ion channel domain-containing protein [Loktanella sp. SALINAS62]